MILDKNYLLEHPSFKNLPEVLREEIEFGYDDYTDDEKSFFCEKFMELVEFDEKSVSLSDAEFLDYLKKDEEEEKVSELVLASKFKREELNQKESKESELEKKEVEKLLSNL